VSVTAEIQQSINEAVRILVITHVDPDGDALGSLTAIGVALTQRGKEVTLVCDDPLPARFAYLPMSDEVKTEIDSSVNYDLIIAVDCGDELRLGRAFASLPKPRPKILNIDHHITNTGFGDINLVEAGAVSATEILYGLFHKLGFELTIDLALSLLTGLVTDTLGFRTVGVNASTLRIAGDLMDAGADLAMVTTQSLNLKPISTLRLWQIGLDKMRLEDGLIWASISDEERRAVGHLGTSTAGLVNLMADVNRAAISAVLLETEDGSIRVGFRCRPPYSVSNVARNLGGGGHDLAAGCTLEGPLDKAEALVVALTKESIQQQEAIFDNGHRH
jgi:phosphoesterase RecJ-like protein